jgi:hypothetical protein
MLLVPSSETHLCKIFFCCGSSGLGRKTRPRLHFLLEPGAHATLAQPPACLRPAQIIFQERAKIRLVIHVQLEPGVFSKDHASPDALRFANVCGALAATRPGAQPSMPTLSEVEALLA